MIEEMRRRYQIGISSYMYVGIYVKINKNLFTTIVTGMCNVKSLLSTQHEFLIYNLFIR